MVVLWLKWFKFGFRCAPGTFILQLVFVILSSVCTGILTWSMGALLDSAVSYVSDQDAARLRLGLARVVFKGNSSLIVFDEPMAAVDPIAESKIIQYFLDIAQHSTTIFVTHRLTTVTQVDRIIVMKDGKIVESGNHDQLYAQEGEYYRLYEAQAVLYR